MRLSDQSLSFRRAISCENKFPFHRCSSHFHFLAEPAPLTLVTIIPPKHCGPRADVHFLLALHCLSHEDLHQDLRGGSWPASHSGQLRCPMDGQPSPSLLPHWWLQYQPWVRLAVVWRHLPVTSEWQPGLQQAGCDIGRKALSTRLQHKA